MEVGEIETGFKRNLIVSGFSVFGIIIERERDFCVFDLFDDDFDLCDFDLDFIDIDGESVVVDGVDGEYIFLDDTYLL
jgi:hypothetical protein